MTSDGWLQSASLFVPQGKAAETQELMVVHAKYSTSFTLSIVILTAIVKKLDCAHLQGGEQGKLCVFLICTFEHKDF